MNVPRPWQRDVGRVVLDGESMRRPTSSTDPPCEVGTEVQLLNKSGQKHVYIGPALFPRAKRSLIENQVD